ncbi:hypothetical protein Cni_G09973 [Canna indica]|uniref:Uncharacterized protein n=1 Tax=Canna indica TaxID=4628 RepID=A0AAQ3K3K6_9LILI|nr:hypothetical protein Cni_G09973 [Canna indica]
MVTGMGAKLIVEVSLKLSQSTIALVNAARQIGGQLVYIFLEQVSSVASLTNEVIEESGLNNMVEFYVVDSHQLLSEYENIDFLLVNYKLDLYADLFEVAGREPTVGDGGGEPLDGWEGRAAWGRARREEGRRGEAAEAADKGRDGGDDDRKDG